MQRVKQIQLQSVHPAAGLDVVERIMEKYSMEIFLCWKMEAKSWQHCGGKENF